MNIRHFILWATWAGILTWILYFNSGEEYTHEWVKILVSDTVKRTQGTISPFWDPKVYWASVEIITNTHIQDNQNFLDKNPNLKMRIQNMSWYRDFLSWAISQEVYGKYIEDAQEIEVILSENPGFLERIQNESWWQKYLRGNISPSDMLIGNMASLLYLQDFERENPEFYAKIQKSPLWNRWIQYGEDYMVMWQQDLVISASLRIQQIHTEPWLREELARFWFSEKDIFTDDWSEWQGIYGAMDVIRRIQAIDTERLEWFYNTDLWKQYRDGKITDWIELEQFLER